MEKLDLIKIFHEIKKGNEDAFGELFHVYYERLVRFAFGYVKQEQNAEDIVSAFFVNLWHKREGLPDILFPDSYLYSSVKNASLNHIRRYGKNAIQDFNKETIAAPYKVDIEQKELQEILTETINNLPEHRKMIFKLVKEDGLQCRQVADILNISVRTVENQLYKAINTLAYRVSEVLGYNPKKSRGKGKRRFLQIFF